MPPVLSRRVPLIGLATGVMSMESVSFSMSLSFISTSPVTEIFSLVMTVSSTASGISLTGNMSKVRVLIVGANNWRLSRTENSKESNAGPVAFASGV